MVTVRVLLSTYNGEYFIQEQIESIYKQKNINISLLIRDDGSTDQTLHLLKKLNLVYPFELIKGNNVGILNSYRIMMKLSKGYKYYAFSDQDDFWMPEKLENAIKNIDLQNIDLYFSNVYITDDKLKVIKKSNIKKDNDFISSIISNKATGCTMVFNNKVFKLVNDNLSISKNYLHDWFTYTITKLYDLKIYFDQNAFILYRQHSNNFVGYYNPKKLLIEKINILFSKKNSNRLQISRFSIVKDLVESKSIFKINVKSLLVLKYYLSRSLIKDLKFIFILLKSNNKFSTKFFTIIRIIFGKF